MQQVGTEWSYRLEVNAHQLPGHKPAWPAREMLANALRALAQRLDGRVSLAVRITTQPPISAEQRIECWRQATTAWERALHHTTHAESVEAELRRTAPQLWR